MTSLALGLVSHRDDPNPGPMPGFEETLETIAIMIERTLKPEDGGNPEDGRAIIRRLAEASQAQFEGSNPIRSGRNHTP